MTATVRSGLVPLIAALLVGAFVLPAWAQERHKISWSARAENTKFTYQHHLDIPDAPGHTIRMFELQRTFPDNPPIVEGLKVVEEVARGMSDVIAGNGRTSGYTVWRLENGDLMFSQWQLTGQAVVNPDRSRKTTFLGTYITTGGTGKLRGIKGLGTFSGGGEFDPEGKARRSEYSAQGEYWMEK